MAIILLHKAVEVAWMFNLLFILWRCDIRHNSRMSRYNTSIWRWSFNLGESTCSYCTSPCQALRCYVSRRIIHFNLFQCHLKFVDFDQCTSYPAQFRALPCVDIYGASQVYEILRNFTKFYEILRNFTKFTYWMQSKAYRGPLHASVPGTGLSRVSAHTIGNRWRLFTFLETSCDEISHSNIMQAVFSFPTNEAAHQLHSVVKSFCMFSLGISMFVNRHQVYEQIA